MVTRSNTRNQMTKLLVVGPGKSLCCTLLSLIGCIFLYILGALYQAEVEELVDGPAANIPLSATDTASSCFIAATMYLATFCFCFWQVTFF